MHVHVFISDILDKKVLDKVLDVIMSGMLLKKMISPRARVCNGNMVKDDVKEACTFSLSVALLVTSERQT